MNMKLVRSYKNKFCGTCNGNCTACKVKTFVNYIGLQVVRQNEIQQVMRTNLPTDVQYRNGKYKQSSGRVFK
jgi:uncharacterized protein YcsI (UPF0317 family)